VSEEDAEKISEKMAKGEMTMDDFLSQLRTLRRMGSMKQLLGMLPGVGGMLKDADIDEGHLKKVESMIQSMTPRSVEAQDHQRPGAADRAGLGQRPARGGAAAQAVRGDQQDGQAHGGRERRGPASRRAKQMAQRGRMPGMGLPMMKTKGSTKSSRRARQAAQEEARRVHADPDVVPRAGGELRDVRVVALSVVPDTKVEVLGAVGHPDLGREVAVLARARHGRETHRERLLLGDAHPEEEHALRPVGDLEPDVMQRSVQRRGR
jgi:hypothetical protein